MNQTPLNRRQALGLLTAGCAGAAAPEAFVQAERDADAATGQKPMIWDTHCHLSGEGGNPEEKVANLIRYADRLGVDRMMIHMGYPIVVDPPPEDIRRQNDQALQAISKFPERTFGFVYLSGRYPEFSVQELNRCVRDGPMVGVKLWVARRCSGPEFDPIVARATELKAPVIQHCWMKVDGKIACAFSSSGGWGGGTELACQSLLTVLMNFGFLVFGVTDYASKLTTAHYGAVTAREPRDEGTQAACRLLGKRLAEWVAVFCDGRKDQHPLLKSDTRLHPG